MKLRNNKGSLMSEGISAVVMCIVIIGAISLIVVTMNVHINYSRSGREIQRVKELITIFRSDIHSSNNCYVSADSKTLIVEILGESPVVYKIEENSLMRNTDKISRVGLDSFMSAYNGEAVLHLVTSQGYEVELLSYYEVTTDA